MWLLALYKFHPLFLPKENSGVKSGDRGGHTVPKVEGWQYVNLFLSGTTVP
jgi:hypothetical protein